MNHITKRNIDKSIESWIIKVLQAKLDGTKVQYRGQKTNWFNVEKDHTWNFYQNEYQLVYPRQYIIGIPEDGKPFIHDTSNGWTRSDFGIRSNGNNYILMEEIDL